MNGPFSIWVAFLGLLITKRDLGYSVPVFRRRILRPKLKLVRCPTVTLSRSLSFLKHQLLPKTAISYPLRFSCTRPHRDGAVLRSGSSTRAASFDGEYSAKRGRRSEHWLNVDSDGVPYGKDPDSHCTRKVYHLFLFLF